MIGLTKDIRAEPLSAYRIHITFSNGDVGVHDFSDDIGEGGPMVEPLRDSQFFGRVFIQSGGPARPIGFDLDAIALHQEMAQGGLLKRTSAGP